MARYSKARGEMWSQIPYSVLSDDDFTAGVGPMGAGVTTLPAKTAKWRTTQGELTQDECNAAAKAFSSKAFDLRHYDITKINPQLLKWIAEHTPQDAVFLTPRLDQPFHWYAGRAEPDALRFDGTAPRDCGLVFHASATPSPMDN